jgi:hypothetical protein
LAVRLASSVNIRFEGTRAFADALSKHHAVPAGDMLGGRSAAGKRGKENEDDPEIDGKQRGPGADKRGSTYRVCS